MSHSENKNIYKISKLKRPKNVVQWKEDFASLAQAEGLWVHFKEEANPLDEKPNPYDNKYLMVKPQPTSKGKRTTRSSTVVETLRVADQLESSDPLITYD